MLRKLWTLVSAPINKAIDSLQAKFPPNRIVVLLTPLVFVPAATWVTGYVAEHFPGLPQLSSGAVSGLMATGALSALAAAYKWLDGWQKHEERKK
ncbi:MAG TPA: hypothetical protein VG898_12475 [Solirubrobacterales bacterium]|nr:hypothetical protein [Solirubrobacterales bacterium]